MRYRHLLLFALIVCVVFVLRIYGVANDPVGVYWDEAAILYDSYTGSQTGLDMHGNSMWQAIYPSYGDYKLPLYIWLSIALMKVFGPSILAMRLVSVIAGTLLVVVMYFLAKEIFRSAQAGLIGALITAFLPWGIHFSRIGFEANVAALMTSVVLLMILKSKQRPVYLLLVALFGALGTYGYFSVRFVLPLFVASFYVLHFRNITKKHVIYLAVASLLYVGLIYPIFRSPWYEASNQFRLSTTSILNTNDHVIDQNTNRELSGNTLVSRLIYHRFWFWGKRLAVNIASHFNLEYLFFWGDSNMRHGTGEVGLMYIAMLPLLVSGIYGLARWDKKLLVFLFCCWLAALVPASIPTGVPHALRSLNAITIVVIFLTAGVYFLMYQSSWKYNKVFLGCISILLVLQFGVYAHDYWTHYPIRSQKDWQYGYRQLAEYVKKIESDYEQIFITDSDGRLFLYFLFFNRVDPALAAENSVDFQIKHFGRYSFQKIYDYDVAKLQERQLYVMTSEEYSDLSEKYIIHSTLYDLSGNEQFILVATDEQ